MSHEDNLIDLIRNSFIGNSYKGSFNQFWKKHIAPSLPEVSEFGDIILKVTGEAFDSRFRCFIVISTTIKTDETMTMTITMEKTDLIRAIAAGDLIKVNHD